MDEQSSLMRSFASKTTSGSDVLNPILYHTHTPPAPPSQNISCEKEQGNIFPFLQTENIRGNKWKRKQAQQSFSDGSKINLSFVLFIICTLHTYIIYVKYWKRIWEKREREREKWEDGVMVEKNKKKSKKHKRTIRTKHNLNKWGKAYVTLSAAPLVWFVN